MRLGLGKLTLGRCALLRKLSSGGSKCALPCLALQIMSPLCRLETAGLRQQGCRAEARRQGEGARFLPRLAAPRRGAQQWQQQLSKLTAQNPDLSPCAPAPEGSCFLHLFLLLPSYLTFVLVLQ